MGVTTLDDSWFCWMSRQLCWVTELDLLTVLLQRILSPDEKRECISYILMHSQEPFLTTVKLPPFNMGKKNNLQVNIERRSYDLQTEDKNLTPRWDSFL